MKELCSPKDEKILLKSDSLKDFIHVFSKKNQDLSRVELAKRVAHLWITTRQTLKLRAARAEVRSSGNGRKQKSIRDIFRKK